MKLTVKVTDSQGNTTTKDIIVTVKTDGVVTPIYIDNFEQY